MPPRPPLTDPLTMRLQKLADEPLWVEPVASGQFAVEGSSHPWWVAIAPKPICGCPDATMRWTRCKHQWAALLCAADPAAVALARQTLGRVPVLPGGHGNSQFQAPAASLGEALRKLRTSKTGTWRRAFHAEELGSWLMTHPGATVLTWRAMAGVEDLIGDDKVQAMLCQIPRAMRDATVRHALVAHAPNPATLKRLMPYCPPAEFRLYFERLIALDEVLMALEALCDPDTPDRIVPLDLVTPHLTDDSGPVRERAIMALQRCGDAPPPPAAPPKPPRARRVR